MHMVYELIFISNMLLSILVFTSLIFSGILSIACLGLLFVSRRIKNQNTVIKKTNASLRRSLDQSQIVHTELHHRVKNNLQVIISLMELQLEDIGDIKAKSKIEDMIQRIYSMAAIHKTFNNSYNEEIKIDYFVNNICRIFESPTLSYKSIIIRKEIENLYFNMHTLMPIGMILHELITNSLKYFKKFKNKLEIDIRLQMYQDYILLKYRDNGPGFRNGTMPSTEGSLGNYLISSMVRQLDGYWTTENDDGAVTHIFIKEKIKYEF